MSFQFRFSTLLQLRRRERDEAGAAVGQAGQAIDRVIGQIREIESQRQEIRQQGVSDRRGSISVDSLLSEGRYDLQLEAETIALGQTLQKLHVELDRRRQILIDAEAEVKRFERLQENDRKQHLSELRRREQFESDDATSRRYTLIRQKENHDR